jgi:hypothetical protein
MGIEVGVEMQAKMIHNILNKIITENFPNQERFSHSGTGNLQDTKQAWQK